MFNFKKKKPEITFESEPISDQPNVEELRVFKDGEYSHSVKILVFPESIIKEIEKFNARKSIS